ncbi:MAG: Gfo/Idh/MocA family oxidoreductase [Deltaproteobacteria bacterium]|nr:Gfo/Idh/MocA family oxidoreductase [Deltaproteobacteria bacterium]
MSSVDSSRNVSIAVVGAGYWGKNLVRNYAELGVLHSICDTNSSALEGFQNQYPNARCTISYQEILDNPEIDGVVLAVPAAMHSSFATEALLSEKDVYVEKPLALDLDDADELLDIATAHSRILMVGHLLQYHPAFIRLKDMVKNGALGRINYIYSNRLSFGKIRREEDILWSFAPHDISMILSLASEFPETVSAIGGNYLHKRIADVTTTHIEFSSGLKAHVFVSWLHPYKEQKLIVVGDKQMAVFNDTSPWGEKLLLYPHNINWKQGQPVPDKKEALKEDVPQIEPLRAECEHFIECIKTRGTPITDAKEGIDVLKVLKASQESLNNNGKKIYLKPDIYAAKPFFVHESSYIDKDVIIGKGTKIWHFSHILRNSRIGQGCTIGQNVVIGPDVAIGNGCKIQNNVSIYKGVTLKDNIFCGPSMVFTNVFNPRAHISRMEETRPTLVKKGATIGANATIICGYTIGEYAFIGAGSTLTRGAPDHALMIGSPARQIGWMCECGNRLDEDLRCSHCGKEYEIKGEGLKVKTVDSQELKKQ